MSWCYSLKSLPVRQLLRVIRAGLLLVLPLITIQPALAGPLDTATTSSNADVSVVSPLSFIKVQDMNFGQIATTGVAGTVIIAPATSTCTTTGGLVHSGTCQAAEFGGMAARNSLVRITRPTSVLLTGPGAPMTLDTFTLDTAPDLTPASGGRHKIVTATGIFNFNVGGTLHVNAAQIPGAYSGTFDITVVYQ